MKPSILFLCTGNSCRSQMAEGWGRALQAENFNFYSAGIEKHGKNPSAIKVMSEAGVDISSQESQTVDELPVDSFDYVITVCGHADDNCPYFPAKTKIIHHGFEDPPKLALAFTNKEKQLDCYRKVRDQIKSFIEKITDYL
ncbi:arsenate reductase ArsC [Kangiella sp. HZ709]|uniref:arsenate reductase ArsC n=1 Tax=Kangiella sp. HZ709 TaxID=2666328 RepID=UPI0012B07408|nr:arsenate reductase ArsC [Kangiella sp. HZ709]MRX27931.1 arsenate reductase ArsC [Kangiella sp. HZ709]